MKEVKFYRIEGYFEKNRERVFFRKEVSAVSEGKAVEKLCFNIGSKHRVKKPAIKIKKVVVISGEELTDPVLKELLLRGEEKKEG